MMPPGNVAAGPRVGHEALFTILLHKEKPPPSSSPPSLCALLSGPCPFTMRWAGRRDQAVDHTAVMVRPGTDGGEEARGGKEARGGAPGRAEKVRST